MAQSRRLHLVLAALLSSAFVCTFASNVPGDLYPTSGKIFNGFTFAVNVTAYANITLDIKDMSALLDAGDFAAAAAIYEAGKYSWRNQISTPQVMRVPKLVIARNYGKEFFYSLASKYYASDSNRYLDLPISNALAGVGEFAAGGPLAAVRAAVIKAWMLFYPLVYYYHEIDAGWVPFQADPNRTNLAGIRAESDDAVGCYLTPSAITGGRVAPGFNPWDVSADTAKYFCTTTMNEAENVMTSKVNVAFRKNSVAIQRLIDASIAANTTLPVSEFAALRMDQQRLLNINQMQLVTISMWKATMAPLCPRPTLYRNGTSLITAPDTEPCEPVNHGAAAWAHWRLVEPVLNNMGVVRERLQVIQDNLHPRMWRARAEKRNFLESHFGKVHRLIRDVATKAGYNYPEEVISCLP